MNKNLYRIIYNIKRGQRMAVAETARGLGKGGSGETGGGFAGCVISALSPLNLALNVALGGLLYVASVQAQIIADPSAPASQRPTVLQTANNLPQVNIQTPSAAGVSRNTYSQFDVTSQGAILNNSRTDVQTQIGGYVQANPWLATGAARVILNEVNSSNPSQLKGYVEVAGQRAEVIIANPAGIAVNGGGFLNASAVTLTTGTAVLNAGSLDSFKVRGGTVSIDGTGLDTRTADYTNILAHAAQVNAGIWAKDLKVVTGANDISASSSATPNVKATTTNTGATPAYALDVAALGGMYAGKIFLVGTEAGLGVRNAGVIGATAGDVGLTNNGLLTNSGSIYANGNTTVITQGSIANTGAGLIAAQGNTTVSAQGANGSVNSEIGATLAAGMDSAGVVGNSGTLAAAAVAGVTLSGKIASGADTNITATSIDVSGATVAAQNATLAASTQDIRADGAHVAVRGTLTAQTQTTLKTDGATINAAQINITAHDLSNAGGKLAQSGSGDMAIILPGTLDNTGGTIASNAQNLTLSATTLTNRGGNISHAGTGALTVNADTFSGSGGTMLSNGALSLNASGAVDLQNATTSAQQVSLTAANLGNQGGRIVQASSTLPAAIIVLSGALDNTGGFVGSNSALQINAGSVTNANGQMTALQSLGLTSSGAVNNSAVGANAGLIQSNGALSVQAASLDNTGATVSSAQNDVNISTGGQTTNTAGQITAAGDVNLTSTSLVNSGAGRIGVNGALHLNSDSIQNGGGQIVAAGNVAINGKPGASSATTLLDNTAGLLQSGATLSVNASQIINAATYTAPTSNATALGLVGQDIQLATSSLNNQGGEVLAGNNLTVQAAHSIDNGLLNSQGGLLYASKALKVQDSALVANPATNAPVATRALQISNTGGTLNAGTSNQIEAAGIGGNGQVLSQGDLSLDVSGDFNNTGIVNGNGNTSISSTGTVNNSGTLSSGQTLTVAAGNLNNAASGTLSGAAGTHVVLTDTLTNRGLIDSGNSAGTSLTLIKAQTVNNLGTGRIYGDNIAVAANTLTNDAETVAGVTKTAVIASRNALDIGVQTLNNNGATILSLGDMAVGGTLDANNRATGAAVTVANSASQIQSVNGNVTINTATLQNLNPTFSYQVVSGAPSAQQTEYILTNGQTVQGSEVAVTNGKFKTYTVAGGFTDPYGKVLLKSDPLGTQTNATIYQAPNIVSYAQVLIGYVGNNDRDDQPIYENRPSVSVPQNNQIWSLVGLAVPTNLPPTGQRPPATLTSVNNNGDSSTEHNPAVDVWDAAAAPYMALQSKIDAMRTSMNAHMVTVQSYNEYTTAAQQAVVSGGTPGTISSAGKITINASSSVHNDNSRILAGGALAVSVLGGQLDNTSTNVTVQTDKTGYNFNWYCVNFRGTSHCGVAYYNQFSEAGDPYRHENAFTQSIPTTVQVSNSQALQYTSVAAPSVLADAAKGGGGVAATINPNVTNATNSGTATVGSTSGPLASKVASTTLNFTLPNSSLYQINSSPTAHYLVQTDPAFTNYKTWLSSDYISAQIALDPSVTQKRLGDGFYEQQLIREQVAKLTGQRFLGNYTSDQQQYQALMDSGLTFAKAYNLRPGIALTAAQVASLTTDIVWLEQQTVTLADGSTTQALVPHVYAATREGDLAPSGALLGGNTVSINTAGDVNNSGTIAGRKLVQIGGNTINNTLGSISGQNVVLNAVQDINNIGGSISADANLSLVAGRDINVTSTTQSSSGAGGGDYSFSQSGIDRVAALYTRGPGTLLAIAGNNIKLTAAQVSSAGDAQISAGNNLILASANSSRSDNFHAGDPDNHFNSSSSKEVGTTIKSAGNTTLAAGNTLIATAANVNATGDLSLNANNVVLLAGQAQAQADSVMTNSDSDMFSSTTTVTRQSQASASAQVNRLAGNNISIQANQDLVSVGSQFAAHDQLTVAGQNSQSFYAAKDTSQSSKNVESSSSLFGGMISLDRSSSTDTRSQAISIGSQLTSTNAINIKVGNSVTLEGATLQADNITFIKTDPSQAGEVNLGGSTDTTQSSHTEKSDTLGVWQEMKGNGNTVQTLNQTSLNGTVSFDSALKITAQIPDTKGGTELKNQINALVTQGSGVGLDYLNALAANPNVQWDKVALANEHWDYNQQGLTGAGAALLTIVVTYFTMGMGTTAVGGTAATATTSATVMGSATLATAVNAGFSTLASQAAVAIVNNGGDIGKTLNQLGSSDSIKNILTTMTTAGALSSLDQALGFTDSTPTATGQTGAGSLGANGVATSQAANQFGQNLLKNITNNIAGAAIDAAISGKPLSADSLSKALSNALITAGMAAGANAIGDAATAQNGQPAQIDAFTQKIAHAILGCAGGAAIAGNGSGCSAGAVGAVVGEMTAEFAKDANLSDANALALARVVSAAAGVLVGGGGDNVAAVNIAATAGANAAENNYLKHAEANRLATLKNQKLVGKCDASCDQEIKQLEELDKTRNQDLAACTGVNTSACNITRQDVRSAAAEYIRQDTKTLNWTYINERNETVHLALDTMTGVTSAQALGALLAAKDGIMALASAARTGFDALVLQDPKAQLLVQAGAGAAWEFVKDPANWPELLGSMSATDREKLAKAYETGDGLQVGLLMGAQLANLPSGGGMGTIKKIDKVLDVAAAAAVASLKADGLDVIKATVGTKGSWESAINGVLEPKTAYVLDNGHTYVTDATGRVSAAVADLDLLKMDRNTYQQCVTGKCGDLGDQGGHLIAATLGGAGDRINLVPQAATLNNGPWKAMENEFKAALDAGKDVSIKIEVGYPPGGGVRPSSFLVDATIDGKPFRREFTQ